REVFTPSTAGLVSLSSCRFSETAKGEHKMNNEYSQFEDGVVDEYTKEPDSAMATPSDYPDTTTYSGDYLSEDFKELAEAPDKPGAPYYDETLNFLEQQWRKTNSEIGSIQTKVFKL